VQSERRKDKMWMELKGRSVLDGNRIEVATRQKVQAELSGRPQQEQLAGRDSHARLPETRAKLLLFP
jgi:hypothetical protein